MTQIYISHVNCLRLQFLAQSAPNPWISSVLRVIKNESSVSEVTLEAPKDWGPAARRTEPVIPGPGALSATCPPLQGRRERLEIKMITYDLSSLCDGASVNPTRVGFAELLGGGHLEVWGAWGTWSGHGRSCPFHTPCPWHRFHMAALS